MPHTQPRGAALKAATLHAGNACAPTGSDHLICLQGRRWVSGTWLATAHDTHLSCSYKKEKGSAQQITTRLAVGVENCQLFQLSREDSEAGGNVIGTGAILGQGPRLCVLLWLAWPAPGPRCWPAVVGGPQGPGRAASQQA